MAGSAILALLLTLFRNRRRRKKRSGSLTATVPAGTFQAGGFVISLDGESLKVSHGSGPERVLWQSVPGESFVLAARGRERVSEVRSHFFIRDEVLETFTDQTLDSVEERDSAVLISGRLAGGSGEIGYTLTFSLASEHRLRFEVEVDEPCNRVYLAYASSPEERFFGFGMQYSRFDMKGRRVPLIIGEPGVGRGLQPLTFLVNLRYGASGSWHSSSACVPHYITSELRSLFLENYEYSVFDLRKDERVRVEVFSSRMAGQIISGGSPAALIERYTEFSGRMRPLPDWIQSGAVVGLQGGSERVLEIYEKLNNVDTLISALWLQDWVGRRKTSFGEQLWWNWELDEDHYPEWEALRQSLADVRLMTYINPFVVELSEKKSYWRNLFAEAGQKGYLVRDENGGPYMVEITDFSAALIDLTNPDARGWIKNIVREKLIGHRASGWMADFGEGLPHGAVLYSGESARSYHNRYAEEWAKVNREAVREAGREDDIVFFHRSGYTRSPAYATLFWTGDHLVSWSEHDGIKSALTAMLSGGLSGYSLNHSDTGGYTAIDTPVLKYHRSKELLMRWIELSAFTPILRTHEGNRPGINHQIYTDEETLRHFSRFAKVYAAWKPYRMELIREAAERGLPVVRHPFIHYSGDPEVRALRWQFMVGTEFMIAPVLEPGKEEVSLYLPDGKWVHLWTDRIYGSEDGGTRETTEAPIGKPALFYRKDSEAGIRFREELERRGLLSRS